MENPPPIDVVCLGHALLDVIADVDDAFLETHNLVRGSMMLVDAERAESLYAAMPPAIESSGGSAANTAAGIAALGGTAAYIGKVRDDQLGRVFLHDLVATGVSCDIAPAPGGTPTGRSLVVVTPDAQRTMNTFLGISSELDPADVSADTVSGAAVTFLEGYMWDDPPAGRAAFMRATEQAHASGRRVALTLSDSFVVERYRDALLPFINEHVDILFANESEIVSLFGTDSFDDAAALVRNHCAISALTRSEKGCVVVAGEATHVVPAESIERVVDTTGAGDLFAAGFLYGLTHGHDLASCGRIGVVAAAEVISHYGPRPETPLRDFVSARVNL